MITNPNQLPRERHMSRQENCVLLLSPTNLPIKSTRDFSDSHGTVLLNGNGDFINGNSASYLPSEPASNEKTGRISLMDKMKNIFKKERVSHSADRQTFVSITSGHKHSKTYATSSDSSPKILEKGLGPFGKGANTRRISEINSRQIRDLQGTAQKQARNSWAPAAIQQTQRSILSMANPATNYEHSNVARQEAAQKQARNSWAPAALHQTQRSILSITNPATNYEHFNVTGRCSLDLSRSGNSNNNANSIKAVKNGGLTNLNKNKFKSSFQQIANFVRSKRDRHVSECSSCEKIVSPGFATAQEGNTSYVHYNTVGAHEYKKIIAEDTAKVESGKPHMISPKHITGNISSQIQNHENPRPALKTEKKNRFTVKSIKRDITMETEGVLFRKNQKLRTNDDINHAQRKTTVISRLLKSPDMQTDFEMAYNTVGPQDNRDRRPSVTLNDFLEMYKEKTFKGGDALFRPKLERKRSNSNSEVENWSQRLAARIASSRKIIDLPVITITPVLESSKCNGQCVNMTCSTSAQQADFSNDEICLQDGCVCNHEAAASVVETQKQACLIHETQQIPDEVIDSNSQTHICSNCNAMVADTVQQHTIPEHTEVHHESPPTIAGVLPVTITKRKNRFEQARGFCRVVNVPESQLAQGSNCLLPCHRRTSPEYNQNLTATSKGCVTPPRDKNSVYDHSLTVSGYPRGVLLLPSQKGFDRRMSEPYTNQQKWPDIKRTIGSPLKEETSRTTRYRKVSAVSLGIDIPSDEFNNKVLIWIANGATKILPFPQADHDIWGKNADGNAAISTLAKRYKCYDVMPPSSKLVLFDSELSVTSAFDAFTFNRVRSAPIWDAKKKQLTGMLTVSDFIQVLLICEKEPELFGKITNQKISDWKNLVTRTKLNFDRNMYIHDDSSMNDSTSTDYDSKSDSGGDRSRQALSCRCSPVKRQSNEAKEEPIPTAENSSHFDEALRANDLSAIEIERSIIDQTKETGTDGDLQEAVGVSAPATDCVDVNNISNSEDQFQNQGNFQSADNVPSTAAENVKAALEPMSNCEDSLSLNDFSDPATLRSSLLRVDDGETDDFEGHIDGTSFTYDSDLISVASDDNLFDAIHTLKTFGFHRVLVMNYEENDPLYILTYKRILYFIYVMMDTINIPGFMSNSIKELNVGNFTNLVTIKYSTSLKEALWSLQSMAVSAIPVVDDDGKVIDLYTKEDVMNLVYNDMFTELNTTIGDVLKTNRRIFEGLFKCKEDDSLMTVVQYFVDSKAHRLVVTDDNNRLLGIVSLSDVVNFMVFGWESDC